MNPDEEGKVKTIKILLVDDDQDDYIIIRDLLADLPFHSFDITWKSNYSEGLGVLIRQDHDICLLDYRLGGSHNGFEILKEASIRGIDMPIIFLTGQGEYAVDVQAMKAGAADYLVKDMLTPSLLERSIRYTLDRVSAARALRDAHDQLEDKVLKRTAELTQANNELRKASQKIKMFAYSISHDLKSPATALYGLTRRLHENYSVVFDKKGHSYCEQILKSAEQILSLVEKINIFISEKEMPLTIEELNLSELLNEIRVEFSDILIPREIRWMEPETLPSIRADRISIIRVLRNLVENALKYGGDKFSYISIGFKDTASAYIVSVSDNGLGLKGHGGKDIFLPFEKEENSKAIMGYGMGLAIVKEIVEKHGGKVWTGQNPDQGATFYFSISKYL